jgi:putative transposase
VELLDFTLTGGTTMTDDRLPLNELLQKAGDGASACCSGERPAIADGGRRRGANRRWPARTSRRSAELANGCRDRTVDTRLGSLNLKIPKLRAGNYFPPFL